MKTKTYIYKSGCQQVLLSGNKVLAWVNDWNEQAMADLQDLFLAQQTCQ